MNYEKYLFCIPTPNGGAGNQIVGIKEALILCYHLNRKFLFPPITQHFIINHFNRGDRYNYKYWKFNTIYNYNDNYLDALENKKILNQIHTQYNLVHIKQPVPVLCVFENIDKNLYNCKNTYTIIASDKINSEKDYNFFKDLDQDILVINFTYLSTRVSQCGINGCRKCKLNSNFETIYKDICSKFDFSQIIKNFGDEYINNNFDNNEFISLHLRYTDYFKGLLPKFKNVKDLKKIFDEEDIYNYLLKLSKEQNIPTENIFIATPVPYRINNSSLKIFKLLSKDEKYDELESFIEQYICCKSKIFVYCGGETNNDVHTNVWKFHKRSSWSSFVTDYRNYLLKKEPTSNILLPEIFGNEI